MWDYDIPPEQCLEVLEGSRNMAGHYNDLSLFRKLIESYRWFTVIRLLPPERISALLTDDLISRLRFDWLKKQYTFIKYELPRALQSETFLRVWIEDQGQELKIEFVNDVASRWGNSHLVSGIPVDNPGNILANKLTALIGRDEPKDVFDIVAIAREYSFSWPDVFEKALNKAIISEPDIAMRLRTFPPEMIQTQRWHSGTFNLEEFKADLNIVCNDFLLASENNLGKYKKHIAEAIPCCG